MRVLICLQFLWKALTFLWYTSSPTCFLPTPCTIQLYSVTQICCQLEMPLPTVIFNFLICLWLLSRFLVMSELTPLSNMLLRSFWDLLSNWVSGAGNFDTVWILRWGPRPICLQGSCALSEVDDFCHVLSQWNTTMDAMPAVYVFLSAWRIVTTQRGRFPGSQLGYACYFVIISAGRQLIHYTCPEFWTLQNRF